MDKRAAVADSMSDHEQELGSGYMVSLDDLELAIVGGGIGDTVL